jgi:ABC-type dipeptide/oligopeptide/nickel transport system ATPase component
MKVILLGNAGAGKSTLSKKLISLQPAARLSLDEVAFEGSTERRPLQHSIADVKRFIAENESWIIEGCYADIIDQILEYCASRPAPPLESTLSRKPFSDASPHAATACSVLKLCIHRCCRPLLEPCLRN